MIPLEAHIFSCFKLQKSALNVLARSSLPFLGLNLLIRFDWEPKAALSYFQLIDPT